MANYKVPDDFATIQAALAVATALDSIDASGSSTSETVTYTSANSAGNIKFGSGTNDRLIIDWTNGTANLNGSIAAQFFADGTNSVTFSGLEHVTLKMGSGNDNITGGTGNDEFYGNDGDDTITALTGTFKVDGGTGNDYLLADLSAVSTGINLDLNSASLKTDIGGGNYIANVERLSLTTGSGADSITTHQDAYDDTINTGTGNDWVTVYKGVDVVHLGGHTGVMGDRLDIVWNDITVGVTSFNSGFTAGDREITFSGAEQVSLSSGSGNDTIVTSGTVMETIDAASGSETIFTYGGVDSVTLIGDGTDYVDGGDGLDQLTIDFTNSTEKVTGSGSTGTGKFSAGTYGSVQFFTFEQYFLYLGSGDDEVTGGSKDDRIEGNDGNDTLSGLDGIDHLYGGKGEDTIDGGTGIDEMFGGDDNDTYIVDDSGDQVFELEADSQIGGIDTVKATLAGTYVLASNVENLILLGSGGSGTGNELANTITGNSGANTLSGGDDAEIDTLTGGDGDDIYDLGANTGDVVVEADGEGTDTIRSSISRTLVDYVENLVLTGTGNINGTGNALSNTITGNSGNNTLSGGVDTEYDLLRGGDGDDTYDLGATTNDNVVEVDGEGTDTILSSISRTVAEAVENLTLTGSDNIDGTGNELANTIIGNSGANRLDGGADTLADRLDGKGGNDTYVLGTSKADTIVEGKGAGTDTVEVGLTFTLAANFENLTLTGTGGISGTGNSAANTIIGNSGANTIAGLGGKDTLTGGDGADRFEFRGASEGGDTITDFSAVDVIRLDGSAFGGLTKANLASSFVVRASDTKAQDANDRLIYRSDTDQLWYDSNGSKAGGLSLIADLDDNFALKASDIQLF